MPDDSLWKDKKYDSAMSITLMSDDEDQVDEDGKRMGRYTSRAPAYRTDIVSP